MGKYNNVTRGQVEALLNKIGGEHGMNAILSGKATVIYKEHFIDLEAEPYSPRADWKTEEHKKGGYLTWDPMKVALFQSKKQQEKNMDGHKLRAELANQLVHNANLLDYLCKNQKLIPEDWKSKTIVFWGTIYRSLENNDLYVRYLIWGDNCWKAGASWLGHTIFNNSYVAAVVAK